MANSLANVNIRFFADLKQFSTEMQNATRKMQKTGKEFKRIGKSMTMSITAPILALGALSVRAFDQQAKAIAQVEAGLKSTGNQVGFTSKKLQEMASDLQSSTLFGDEEILKGATAQLLTFTNITGEQFARTQKAALDLATRLDGDLKSASIQLGKALNDPVANLSALSRSGIQFSKDQKQVINSLVETGRLADAQTLILNELEKQYGGSAEAAVSGAGKFKQTANILGDVGERFGKIIAEGLTPFLNGIQKIAKSFLALSDRSKKMIVIFGGIAAAIGPVLIGFGFLWGTALPMVVKQFTVTATFIKTKFIPLMARLWAVMAANPITAIAIALVAVSAAFVLFKKNTDAAKKAQEALLEVNSNAEKSIVAEKVALEKNLQIAKDETKSKEARLSAIKKLNDLSPEYLGNLNLENINTDKARIATDKYTASLLKQAKVKAAEEKLIEIQKQLLDVGKGETGITFGEGLVNYARSFGNLGKTVGKNVDTIVAKVNGLKAQEKALLDFIVNTESAVDGLDTTNAVKGIKKLKNITIEYKYANDALFASLEQEETESFGFDTKKRAALVQATKELNAEMALANQKFKIHGDETRYINEQVGLYESAIYRLIEEGLNPEGKAVQNLNEKMLELKGIQQDNIEATNNFNASIGQLSDSFSEMADTAIVSLKNLLNVLREAVRNYLKLQAIQAITGEKKEGGGSFLKGLFTTGLNALTGGIGGGIFSAIFPKFAEGGTVVGKQLAIVGDNRSGVEHIVPDEKKIGFAKSILGGNSGMGNLRVQVSVAGAIQGNTIRLSGNRANTTVGRRFGF